MTKKNLAIKHLTEAHGWLGVAFSFFLFVIFWAGSLSLFRAEIEQWAEAPHYPAPSHGKERSLNDIVSPLVDLYSVDTKKTIRIFLPSDDRKYLQLRLPQKDNQLTLKVDPVSGKVLTSESKFELINFIYELHYNLQLSQFGLYFIGVVTLFFLFALLSGVFIHAKKITSHFFSFRIQKNRTKLLDLHNIVGVMSLPFTLMYAVTGLVFNLLIVFQIAFVVFIYEGDLTAMTTDAGFDRFETPAPTGKRISMHSIDSILNNTQILHGPAGFISVYNYGDENAVVQIFGSTRGNFEPRYERYIRIRDGVVLRQEGIDTYNTFKQGRRVLSKLHFGSFADLDLRILYFLLGMAVTIMIVAGNMLWINKRQNNRNVSSKVTNFVSDLTLGACSGVIVATAIGLFAERLLPLALEDRPSWVIGVFLISLVTTLVSTFFIQSKKQLIISVLNLSAITLLLTALASWILFDDALRALWQHGLRSVIAVDIGLLLSALTCFAISRKMKKGLQQPPLANS